MSLLRLEFWPLARLWSLRRALLALLVGGLWALGLGWIAVVQRFNAVEDRTSDADLMPLVLSTSVVALPALAGILVSEALHELQVRRSLAVLPGLARRLRAASLALAVSTTMAAVVTLGPALAGGALPIAGLAGPAALGFAAGLWVLVRSGGSLAWSARILSLGALLYLAPDLVALARSEPLLSVPMLLAALATVPPRTSARLARRLRAEQGRFLRLLSPAEERRSLARSASRAHLVPPAVLGHDLAGWRAARDWLWRTRGLPARGRPLLVYGAVCVAACLLGPGLATLVGESEDRGRAFLALVADLLLGVPSLETRVDAGDGRSTLLLLVVAAAVHGILVSRPPFAGHLPPAPRRERARLALDGVLRLAPLHALCVALLGTLLGLAALAYLGRPAPPRLPAVAWSAGLGLLATPPVVALLLAARRRLARRHELVLVVVLIVLLGEALFPVGHALSLDLGTRPEAFVDRHAVPLLLAGSLVWGLELLALRAFLRWHWSTVDLMRT